MAGRLNRGEIWMYRFRPPDKRRPVLVLSRREAIDVLHTVTVAPITSTVRGAPSEVLVGIDQGLGGCPTYATLLRNRGCRPIFPRDLVK